MNLNSILNYDGNQAMLNTLIEQPPQVTVRCTVTLRSLHRHIIMLYVITILVKFFVGLSCQSLMSQLITILNAPGQ